MACILHLSLPAPSYFLLLALLLFSRMLTNLQTRKWIFFQFCCNDIGPLFPASWVYLFHELPGRQEARLSSFCIIALVIVALSTSLLRGSLGFPASLQPSLAPVSPVSLMVLYRASLSLLWQQQQLRNVNKRTFQLWPAARRCTSKVCRCLSLYGCASVCSSQAGSVCVCHAFPPLIWGFAKAGNLFAERGD